MLGDALVQIDDVELGAFEDLVAALAARGGERATLKLVRAGELQEVEVTLSEKRRRC
jgi:S1-C subfamily serine protease